MLLPGINCHCVGIARRSRERGPQERIETQTGPCPELGRIRCGADGLMYNAVCESEAVRAAGDPWLPGTRLSA
jgi:hypothetical protein